MSSKQVLLVDDHRPSVQPFIEMLEGLGYDVDYRDHPDKGIQTASHKYGAMFVDYHFDNTPKTNGAGIGRLVRKEYPLLPLILMTDRGEKTATWGDSVNAGFDAFFPKAVPGERPPKTLARLKKTIRDAEANIAKTYKMKFDEKECAAMSRRLEALQNAYEINAGKTGKIENLDEVTQVAGLLLKSGRATLTEDEQRDIKLMRARNTQSMKEAAKVKFKHRLPTSNSWAMYFKLHDRSGRLDQNGLIARYLFLRYPERWTKVRENYKQVKKIVRYFALDMSRS